MLSAPFVAEGGVHAANARCVPPLPLLLVTSPMLTWLNSPEEILSFHHLRIHHPKIGKPAAA